MSTFLAKNERRRRSEMNRARNTQQQLLPEEVAVAGLRLTHFDRPAEDVAGDYYDIMSLPRCVCLLAVADVTGHRVPAALSGTWQRFPSSDVGIVTHLVRRDEPSVHFFIGASDSGMAGPEWPCC